MQDMLDRIGPEGDSREAECAGGKVQRRNEAGGEDQWLDQETKLPAQKFLLRSMPVYRLAT